jgi:hypothetical protein
MKAKIEIIVATQLVALAFCMGIFDSSFAAEPPASELR